MKELVFELNINLIVRDAEGIPPRGYIVGAKELRQQSEKYVMDTVWLDWRAFQTEVGKRA